MILSKQRKLLTKEEIKDAFNGTNFGSEDPEHVIKFSLLKAVSGYATGHTAKCILQELSLLSRTKYPKLTPRGQYCLWEYFQDGYRTKVCACCLESSKQTCPLFVKGGFCDG